MTRALAWWFGKTATSDSTTFSRLVALKTTISAISLGVRGSTPLEPRNVNQALEVGRGNGSVVNLRVNFVCLALVATKTYDRELLLRHAYVSNFNLTTSKK